MTASQTTREERDHWLPLFSGFPSGSAPDFTYRLIADLDQAEAERDRLREALEAIIIRCEEGDKRTDWLSTIASLAHAALKGAKP